jgi:hypothetical protein
MGWHNDYASQRPDEGAGDPVEEAAASLLGEYPPAAGGSLGIEGGEEAHWQLLNRTDLRLKRPKARSVDSDKSAD